MGKKENEILSTTDAAIKEYEAACNKGLIRSTSKVDLQSTESVDSAQLKEMVLAALSRRRENNGLTPISSPYDCDGTVEELAAALSDEPLQFLRRPTTDRDIFEFSTDQSIEKAENYVRANAGTSIQYGWLLFGDSIPSAYFHAAVRKADGSLILVDENIAGLAFEHTIAFLPDSKNRPNRIDGTIPTEVWRFTHFDETCLGIAEIDRSDICPDLTIIYGQRRILHLPLSTPLFKAGMAPHQASEALDRQTKITYDAMCKKEKQRQKKFNELIRLAKSYA